MGRAAEEARVDEFMVKRTIGGRDVIDPTRCLIRRTI
jgi:hypothetical protein